MANQRKNKEMRTSSDLTDDEIKQAF